MPFYSTKKDPKLNKEKEIKKPLIQIKKPVSKPDIVKEQTEKPVTTTHCPQSINEEGLKSVKKNPQLYLEINIITKSRIVDNFYIPNSLKNFTYKNKKYGINQELVYLLPTKAGFLVPTCFYTEDKTAAKSFKKTNKGITGKALSLLYEDNLYVDLFSEDESRYNLFIALFLLVSIILIAIGLYLTFFYNPETATSSGNTPGTFGLIFGRLRFW